MTVSQEPTLRAAFRDWRQGPPGNDDNGQPTDGTPVLELAVHGPVTNTLQRTEKPWYSLKADAKIRRGGHETCCFLGSGRRVNGPAPYDSNQKSNNQNSACLEAGDHDCFTRPTAPLMAWWRR